jgi:hypothetical protein
LAQKPLVTDSRLLGIQGWTITAVLEETFESDLALFER